MRLKPETGGVLALLFASAIYTSYGPLARVMAGHFSLPFQVAFRTAVASVVLGVIALFVRPELRLTGRRLWLNCWLGVNFTITGVLFAYSVNHTTLTNAVFLYDAMGLLTSVILGRFVFGESVHRRIVGAVVLALVGVGLICNPEAAFGLGVLAAVGGGIGGGFLNATRRLMSGVSWVTVLLYQSIITTCIASVIMLVTWSGIEDASLAAFSAGSGYALAAIAVNVLLLYGFARVDLGVGSVIIATELVFIVIVGLFYSEVPTLEESVGCLLIATGTVVAVRRKKAVAAVAHVDP